MSFIFEYLTDGLKEGAEVILTGLSKYSLEIFNQPLVTSVLDLMQYIGYILFTIGLLFSIFNMMAAMMEGESGVNLHFFFINFLKGLTFVVVWKDGALFLYNLCLTLQDCFKTIVDFTPDYKTLTDFIVDITGISILWKFIILVFLMFSVIFSLYQCLKRGAIYFVHIALGYFYAISVSQGQTDGMFNWAKQTLAVAVTNCFQVALIFLGMKLANSVETLFLGVGILGAAISIEKVAGYFGHSTGSLKQISGAAKTITSGIRTMSSISMMRR